MSLHVVDVNWTCNGDFAAKTYSRVHTWRFDGGAQITASASPEVVPLPQSSAEAVDPEEAFIASISSCHMLWFLDHAASAGLTVDAYHDRATGRMAMRNGRVWIPEVTLQITVTWGGAAPEHVTHETLHHKAHADCFIANSVRTEITHKLL